MLIFTPGMRPGFRKSPRGQLLNFPPMSEAPHRIAFPPRSRSFVWFVNRLRFTRHVHFFTFLTSLCFSFIIRSFQRRLVKEPSRLLLPALWHFRPCALQVAIPFGERISPK